MANAPSKLEPHRQFIATERGRGTTYRRILEMLAEKDVAVTLSALHNFVKVRSKKPRQVITMWQSAETSATPLPQNVPAATETPHPPPATTPQPDRASQRDAIQRLKAGKATKRNPTKGLPNFNEDSPLDRLSDADAKRLRDEL